MDFSEELLESADSEEFPDEEMFAEYIAGLKGMINAYQSMYNDVDTLSEDEFIELYDHLLHTFEEQLDLPDDELSDGANIFDFNTKKSLAELNKLELVGYCSAVIQVMEWFVPGMMLPDDDMQL